MTGPGVADSMLNLLCPNLPRFTTMRTNSYSFETNYSFDLSASSLSQKKRFDLYENDSSSFSRLDSNQKRLYFRKQSSLVEESIYAMDADINSLANNAGKEAHEDKGPLMDSKIINLYNRILTENLGEKTRYSQVYKEFCVPLRLDLSADVTTYPYQFEDIKYQFDSSKDIDAFTIKLLPNEYFYTEDLHSIANRINRGASKQLHKTVSIESTRHDQVQSASLSFDKNEIEIDNPDILDDGINLDDEFDFEDIEMDDLSDAGEESAQRLTVEIDAPEFGQVSMYLWGENNCTVDSLLSAFQTSLSLNGLSERIFVPTTRPIYSIMDLTSLELQKQSSACEKFISFRKILGNYLSEPVKDVANIHQSDAACLLSIAGLFYTSLLTCNPTDTIAKLISTTIYDLNAPNTVYTLKPLKPSDIQSGFFFNNSFLIREMDGLAYLRPPIEGGEGGDQDKSAESYKKWKRRMQILDKETRLALVNMGKSFDDIQSTFMRMESKNSSTSILEFYKMTQLFENVTLDKICNHSFDEIYNSRPIYQGAFTDSDLSIRPIMHCRLAMNFAGAIPICGKAAKVAMARFHRPDFRDGIFKAHLQHVKTGFDPSGLWSSWKSYPLFESTVLNRYKQQDYEGGELPVGMYVEDDKEETNLTHHPANYFLDEFDLSLTDDCPFALLEYIEQFPFYLSNPGMASRVSRYMPSDEPDEPENTGKNEDEEELEPEEDMINNPVFDMFKDDSRILGPLGMVNRTKGIDMFGVVRKIRYGMTLLENHLYKAPLFVHPLPKLKDTAEQQAEEGSEVSSAQMDLDDDDVYCDFLLIRRSWEEEGETKVGIFVRSIVPVVASDACGDYQGGVLYTVGQCEPKLEVPSPDSKVYYEDMKSLIKAWVIRNMIERSMDYKRLRDSAKAAFCPHIPERDIIQIIKSVEQTKSTDSESKLTSVQLRPETVCLLESSRVALQRLQMIGISSLQAVDRLTSILMLIQREENESDLKFRNAKKACNELKAEYEKRLEALGLTKSPNYEVLNKLSTFPFDFAVSLYGHVGVKHYFPLVRFVEETLKLTPWNITKECKMVLSNKGSAQFMLYGFADPSGGRGESINLLKRQNRDQLVSAGAVAGTMEDLRKLSMPELRNRLVQYGVSEHLISSLPRWDQVALVRQYRSGFGIAGDDPDGFKFRLAPSEYQARINRILDKQHLALAVDDPVMDDHITFELGDGEQQLTNIENVEGEDHQEGESMELDDLVDELVDSAMDDGNDYDLDDDQNVVAEMEERELNIFRQQKEATNLKTEDEKWEDANKLVAVPGIVWVRRYRPSPMEDYNKERGIFIYGKDNILDFLKWRNRRDELRVGKDKTYDEDSSSVLGAESKRLCRACGQPGHIASNVKCPFYRGGKVRIERNKKGPMSTQIDAAEILASTDAVSETCVLDTIAKQGLYSLIGKIGHSHGGDSDDENLRR